MSSSGLGDDEQQPPQWQQPQWKSGDPLDQTPQPEQERPSWQQQDPPSWQPQDQPSWQQQQPPSWQQPQEPSWQQNSPQWGPNQWQPGPRTPGSATAALIIGICGLCLCWPVGGPLAVIYGNKAKNEIANSNGNLAGGGLATAGIVMGWIAIALTALTVLGVLATITL